MPIDTEPGGSTMIRVSTEVRELIESVKIIPREPLNDCLKRIIKENQAFHKIYPSTQTKERMQDELERFVMNPDVPDTGAWHRAIWLKAHPGEVLHNTDYIHHINGNHDDNRPENLMKTTEKEHAKLHAELNKKNTVPNA
jgi:hypothetical protein